MKLFKNGISVKWILLVIGIVAISGISVATTNPYITNSGASLLDALNVTNSIYAAFYHGDGTNITGVAKPGSINTFTTSQKIINSTSGALVVLSLGGNSATNATKIEFVATDGVTQKGTFGFSDSGYLMTEMTSGTGDILCYSSGIVKTNTGATTTCAPSAEKYKTIKGNFNDSTVPNKFSQLEPIIFSRKDDVKQLDSFGFSANKIAVLYPQTVYTRYQGKGTFVKVIVNQSDSTKADAIQYSDGTIASIEGINYEMFSAILVNQVQNQQFQLEIQAAQIRNICTNNPQLCS